MAGIESKLTTFETNLTTETKLTFDFGEVDLMTNGDARANHSRLSKKHEASMPCTVVLAVGYNPLLLETRSQVLRSAGYTVVSVCSLKEAISRFLQGDFDLVVLCHSIPAHERERLAHIVREHTPRTPVIFVSPGFPQHDPFADVTIENDPNDLVTGLHEALRSNGEKSGV